MTRIAFFFQLVFRPHPYCTPAESAWEVFDNWTRFLVGPLEAWRIAGVLAHCPASLED